jgi:TATA-binding protein-associated factor
MFQVNNGSWPFEALFDQLLLGLFSCRWETRHGAALCVKEFMRVFSGVVGMRYGVTSEENIRLNLMALEDICIRLLCVLCLDR